jgi:hypothetical protein
LARRRRRRAAHRRLTPPPWNVQREEGAVKECERLFADG